MKNENTNNLKYIDYYGYKIYKDGRIENKKGKLMSTKDRKVVRLTVNGQIQAFYAERLIYSLYNNVNLTRKDLIAFKDGNVNNLSLDNLILIEKKDYFKKTKWNNEKKLTEKQELELVKKYNREERYKSGSAKKVIHPTYNDLCREYGISKSLVMKTLNKHDPHYQKKPGCKGVYERKKAEEVSCVG